MHELQKIVVVIDTDNTQPAKIGEVLREVSMYGRIVVKRAYGNWRKDALKNWEPEMKRLSIKPVQQFDYVSGKNATDIALVIDTIDLLHTGLYDGFVIVSSDSDYTPLVMRLHESGVYVIGAGERKTPACFQNACDRFLLLEHLCTEAERGCPAPEPPAGKSPAPAPVPAPPPAAAPEKAPAAAAPHVDKQEKHVEGIDEIHKLLQSAFQAYQENGFANLAAAGSFLKKARPDFKCRTYGYSKLPQFLEAFPRRYEVKRQRGKGNSTIVVYRCVK